MWKKHKDSKVREDRSSRAVSSLCRIWRRLSPPSHSHRIRITVGTVWLFWDSHRAFLRYQAFEQAIFYGEKTVEAWGVFTSSSQLLTLSSQSLFPWMGECFTTDVESLCSWLAEAWGAHHLWSSGLWAHDGNPAMHLCAFVAIPLWSTASGGFEWRFQAKYNGVTTKITHAWYI